MYNVKNNYESAKVKSRSQGYTITVEKFMYIQWRSMEIVYGVYHSGTTLGLGNKNIINF